MQQDKKAIVPSSSSRLSSRSGSPFRRPPVLLPLEEKRTCDSDEHAGLDNARPLAANMPGTASTPRPAKTLPLLPGAGIPNGGFPDSFILQAINYDELDEQ